MRKNFFIVVALTVISTATAFAGGEATWSYMGDTGPDKWGPIDIRDALKVSLPPLSAAINPTPLKFGLDGPTFAVPYQPGSWITINDGRYELQAFHFHHPSEHTLNGKHYPLEAHMVLRRDGSDHNNAVMGVFIDVGKTNGMLNQFWDQLPRDKKKAVEPVEVNVGDLLPAKKEYYMYEGSMTTPGCTQGVRWFVLKHPVEASQDQIDRFIDDLTEGEANNRPVQPTYGRVIVEN